MKKYLFMSNIVWLKVNHIKSNEISFQCNSALLYLNEIHLVIETLFEILISGAVFTVKNEA